MKNLVSIFSIIYYATKILILVSLFQWWMGTANAASTVERNVEVAAALESQRELLNLLGDGTFTFKESIGCNTLLRGTDSYWQSRGTVNYYRCPDLTLSFPQPDSTGLNGWNGYCGQTTVSTIVGMLCNRFIDPKVIDQYASDVTPGNRPSTNQKALKKIFTEDLFRGRVNNCPEGVWKEYTASNENKYIEDLKSSLWAGPGKVKRKRNNGSTINITPVAVLISAGLKTHHWVTLVDFKANRDDKFGCDAVVNTWGNQKVITCANLAKFGDTTLFGYRYLTLEN